MVMSFWGLMAEESHHLMSSSILTRRISSFLALSIIVFLAFVVGAIAIYQSSKFKALQAETPLPYSQVSTGMSADY